MYDQAEERLRVILERCYEALAAGREPELGVLCGGDAALRARVERLLARERAVVAACRSEPSLPPLSPGVTRIGDFTLLDLLGVGGMSHVYRARQEPLGREVALKVLRADLVASDTGRLRFQREATITAALDHPHIVPVYAAGTDGAHVYLAMKLLRGRPLDRVPLPMPAHVVATIGEHVASALQAAHDIGVVHRDLKPANVMLDGDVAYALDFGLSSFVHDAGVVTRQDATPGTLLYLAPEMVVRRQGGLDPRVDVYGLGATLYELLSGRPPFEPGHPVRVLHQILHVDPAPLRLSGRSRDLETIVMRSLDKSPQRRFQTAAEMMEELRRFRAGLPIRSRRLGWPTRCGRFVGRHRLASGLAGIAALLLSILVAMLASQRQDRLRALDADVAGARAALAVGDLQAAEARLARVAGNGPSRVGDDLGRDITCERSLQALIASLQGPEAHQDPRAIARSVADLVGSSSPLAESARADAALAIATRVIEHDPLAHRPLAVATRAVWPRTAAALLAWSRGVDPEAALRDLPPNPAEPHDHLFAALVLRLGHRAEAVVERELRTPLVEGPAADPIRYSIAVALEAQGEYVAAFDVLGQLLDSPIYAALAACDCARLAAHLGRRSDAERLLGAARASGERSTHFLPLLVPSELDVLLELGDPAFWPRWNAAAATHRHLALYWLRGGYAAAHDAASDPESATRARSYFERGLACDPDPPRRAALEVALLQLDWMLSSAVADLEPLPEDASHERERVRLAELAERAERIAAHAGETGRAPSISADALLVAAQARRAIGDRRRGWALLERGCREHDDAALLARFAYQVGFRAAHVLVNGPDFPDPDAEAGEPLAIAVAKGAFRARFVLDRTAAREIDDAILFEARVGLFLCAMHAEDPRDALSAALALRDHNRLDAPLRQMVGDVVAGGGLALAHVATERAAPARLVALLDDACAAVERAFDARQLTATEVAGVVRAWRALRRDEGAATDAWSRLWQRVALLERRAAASPR